MENSMENMSSGGVWRTVWRICLLGGYGERYGEYAFWGGMENSMENMPSGGGVWRTVWRICLLGGVWRTVWRIAFSGGGVKGLNCKRNFLLEGK